MENLEDTTAVIVVLFGRIVLELVCDNQPVSNHSIAEKLPEHVLEEDNVSGLTALAMHLLDINVH